MRLGLFGGSFDPVHWGHLLLAESAREQCRLDKVVFVPAGVPPHKRDRELSAGTQRAEMLELAIGGHEQFSVSRWELDRGGVSYTVETLRHFCSEHPCVEIFLLVGADMLHDLPHWYEAREVCRLAVPAAVNRPGSETARFDALASLVSPERLELFRQSQVDMPQVGLSSTDIRRRVSEERSIRYLTPRAVEKYIQAQGLYR